MFTLDSVVPWGRSFDEYVRMFALSERDLSSRILGCGDGPASFNAGATARGSRVTSCDPIYRWTAAQIRDRIDATSGTVLEQTRLNAAEFVWTDIDSIDALKALRLGAMDAFLRDFGAAGPGGRYVAAALPSLPFAAGAFDLAVCSHVLFLYSNQFDEAFHLNAVDELCRVASEVRIFPLLALGGAPSVHVTPVLACARAAGRDAAVERVPYEFQRGAMRCCGFGQDRRRRSDIVIHVQPVTLEGNGIRLEPLTRDHHDAVEAAAADGRLWELWFTSVPEPGQTMAYMDAALKGQDEGHRLPWAVRDLGSGRIVGCTSYHDIVAAIDRVEIGWTWYGQSWQRSHVNTSCKLLLLSHAFDTLGCKVVGLRTDNFNFRSQRAIEGLGAKRDGILRHHQARRDGTVRDTYLYSILATEWPDVRRHLEARLVRHMGPRA